MQKKKQRGETDKKEGPTAGRRVRQNGVHRAPRPRTKSPRTPERKVARANNSG